MPRDFNIDLNKSLLNTEPIKDNPKLDDENINRVMKTADDIIELLAKNNVNLEDSYYILCSLADSIYMYATTGPE